MIEIQNLRREVLSAKTFIAGPKVELQPLVVRKMNLNFKTNQAIMQSLSFWVFLASLRRNESQKFNLENFSLIEFNTWTGCVVIPKISSNTKTNYTHHITRKTKRMLFETWRENIVLKDNDYKKDESYLYSSEHLTVLALFTKSVSFPENIRL